MPAGLCATPKWFWQMPAGLRATPEWFWRGSVEIQGITGGSSLRPVGKSEGLVEAMVTTVASGRGSVLHHQAARAAMVRAKGVYAVRDRTQFKNGGPVRDGKGNGYASTQGIVDPDVLLG